MDLTKIKNIGSSLYDFLIDNIRYVINRLNELPDKIINSSYYKSYISIILTLVFVLLVVLINLTNQNLTNLSNKYIQIITLLLAGILLSIFYFFVYRNEYDKKAFIDKSKQIQSNPKYYYNDNTRKLIKDINITDKKGNPIKTENNENLIKKVFNYENYKLTVKQPLINLLKFISILFLNILAIVFFIGFIYYLYTEKQYLYSFTKICLGLLIIITILSIIAKFSSIVLKNCENKENFIIKLLCLIKNFIFFIPCLLVIFVDNINKDIKATPSSIYLLFILLIILVLLYIGLPIFFKFLISLNKHDLLAGEGPYYLDKKREIGSYQKFSKDHNKVINKILPSKSEYTLFDEDPNNNFNIKAIIGHLENKKKKFVYNYSISFYVYLNPQGTNTSLAYNKETEIFNYGNKPVILYDGNSRKLLVKSRSQTSEGSQTDTIYETKKFKYQKWMLIQINYENNQIDVFIDGKLVGSKNNVPPYFNNDKITIGEDNGIHGSIKEIYYFDTPTSPNNMEFLYDLTIKPLENKVNFVKDRFNDTFNNNILL